MLGSFFLPLAVAAHLAASAEPVDVTVDLSFASRYQWRGLVLSDGPVFQPSLDLGFQEWNLNFWGSMELSNANEYEGLGTGNGRFTEWNTTLTYTLETGRDAFTLGYTYYDYPNTGAAASNEVFAVWERAGAISTIATAFYDFDEIDGLYLNAGATKSWDVTNLLTNDGDSANLTFQAGIGWGSASYNLSIFGVEKAGLNDFSVALSYELPIDDKTSIWMMGSYQFLLDRELRDSVDRSSHLGLSAGVSFRF